LGRAAHIATGSNMWAPLFPCIAISRERRLMPNGSGTGFRTLNLAVGRSLRQVQKSGLNSLTAA